MNKIKLLNIALLIFISYYLFIKGGNKDIIEGVDASSQDTGAGAGIKCVGNALNPSLDVQCTKHPLEYKDNPTSIYQCLDRSINCTNQLQRCCDSITEVCQGNLDPSKDITCNDGSWPKVNSAEYPYRCKGTAEDDEYCWKPGNPSLSELSEEQKQSICCTSRNDFVLAEQFWGIPYLINKASKKYDDSKIFRESNVEKSDKLLNEALEKLYEARQIDDKENPRYNTIPELISDWGNESGHPLGSGMCLGNIDEAKDIDCLSLNKAPIEKAFITPGTNQEVCCVSSGLCSGNTNPGKDIQCPDGMVVKGSTLGTTIEECCEKKITCTGNPQINDNFRCPPPLIPVKGADKVFGNTRDVCCRHPDDKDVTELILVSENETIYGTLIINAELFQLAGLEGSSKRIIFENNFKKDIVDILNAENKINILPEQIIIEKVYDGSIVIDFKVVPHSTGVSITKEYFSYLLSSKVYLKNTGHYTAGGITNVKVISWTNIENWPQWIWNVIIGVVTFIIAFAILM